MESAAAPSIAGVDLNPAATRWSSPASCCAACRTATFLENTKGGSLTDLGAHAEPIRIRDGWFTPPDRPGHGIIFDRAALAAHAVNA